MAFKSLFTKGRGISTAVAEGVVRLTFRKETSKDGKISYRVKHAFNALDAMKFGIAAGVQVEAQFDDHNRKGRIRKTDKTKDTRTVQGENTLSFQSTWRSGDPVTEVNALCPIDYRIEDFMFFSYPDSVTFGQENILEAEQTFKKLEAI